MCVRKSKAEIDRMSADSLRCLGDMQSLSMKAADSISTEMWRHAWTHKQSLGVIEQTLELVCISANGMPTLPKSDLKIAVPAMGIPPVTQNCMSPGSALVSCLMSPSAHVQAAICLSDSKWHFYHLAAPESIACRF